MTNYNVPSKEVLLQSRFHNEFDLYQLQREGMIYKDNKGFFTHEIIRDGFFGDEVKGEKFYITDMYEHIEKKIISLYTTAQGIEAKLDTMNTKKDRQRFLASYIFLITLDYRLHLLHGLHQGTEGKDVFLSPEQIDEWLEDRSRVEEFADMMTMQESGPLGVIEKFSSLLDMALTPQTLEDQVAVHQVEKIEEQAPLLQAR